MVYFAILLTELIEIILPHVTAVFLMILISVIARFVLAVVGQQWIKTLSHTTTITMLPIITYVITKVISGNIALSLGMVGALSIVRFRNPVRSPLELTVYFSAITMGIAASVSIKWLVFFSVALAFVTIVLWIINFFSISIFKKNYFHLSFSEGNSQPTLEISVAEKVKFHKKGVQLISSSYNDKRYSYIFSSPNPKDLEELSEELQANYNLESWNFNG